MRTYELIVERMQPPCGGKDSKEIRIMTVETEDPVEYVRGIEKAGELEVSTGEEGEIIVSLDVGKKQIRYTFTED